MNEKNRDEKSTMEAYESEYAMSGGDNAASRKQINNSIVSEETANEVTFAKALMKGLGDIAK
jgi:hypothetical protein